MPLTTEQQTFQDQIASVSQPLAVWTEEQMLGGRTLESVQEQIRRVMGVVGPLREDGKILIYAPREVKIDMLSNAVIGLVENGMSHWLQLVSNVTPDVIPAERPPYADNTFWQNGGAYDWTCEDPDGGPDKHVRVSLAEMISGVEKMAALAPEHFNDLVSENDDAITHDVLGQMIVYGEIIYG